MVDVVIDTIETIAAEMYLGNVTKLTRKARVSGLTYDDYRSLFQAMQDAGIPPYGSSLSEAPNCVVTRHSVTMVDKDRAEVIIVYEEANGEGYDMDSPPFGSVYAEGSASLNQLPTNLDRDGNPSFVSYDYVDDPEFGTVTKQQGGQFDYFQPQHSIKFRGTKFDGTPSATAAGMQGKVNDGTWNGGDAGTWMCTKCDYKLFDTSSSPHRYFFDLEFQYNPDGWQPTIIFIDERTGKPPVGLVPGTGYKTIDRYEEVDFDTVFGAVLSAP